MSHPSLHLLTSGNAAAPRPHCCTSRGSHSHSASTVLAVSATVQPSTLTSSHSSSLALMTSAASASAASLPSHPAVTIDIPATTHTSSHHHSPSKLSSPPSSSSSPSKDSHHPSRRSQLSTLSIERYWPLLAVTIASIYLITLVPFVAPGLFLIQFSLLRYIRHHSDKADAANAADHSRGGRWMKDSGRRRTLTAPAMAVIVEETNEEEAAAAEEEVRLPATSKSISPLHTRRPPPLTIPHSDAGIVTQPTPVLASSHHTTTAVATLPAVFPTATRTSASAWDDASNELNQLLSSSMQMLQVERQMSAEDLLMAASTALFVPSLLQPLTSHLPSPASSTRSSHRAFSFAGSTASTDDERSVSSGSFSSQSLELHSPLSSFEEEDDNTLTPQRRNTKSFVFDGLDEAEADVSVVVMDAALERRMEELMCVV